MTDDSADIVEAVRALRELGAVAVEFRGCKVAFAGPPERARNEAQPATDPALEMAAMALRSAM